MRSKNVVKREAVLLTTAGVSGLTTHLAGVGWGRDGRNGRDHDWILLGEIIAAVEARIWLPHYLPYRPTSTPETS